MADFDAKTRKKADMCKDTCPMCTYSRKKGRGLLYRLVKLEAKVCPACKAYEKVYGVPAWERPPES